MLRDEKEIGTKTLLITVKWNTNTFKKITKITINMLNKIIIKETKLCKILLCNIIYTRTISTAVKVKFIFRDSKKLIQNHFKKKHCRLLKATKLLQRDHPNNMNIPFARKNSNLLTEI